MFVSYHIQHSGYGFMSFKRPVPLKALHAYLNRVFYHDVTIICMKVLCGKVVTEVFCYTESGYKTLSVNKVDSINTANELYDEIYHRIGDHNILEYH